ncbi:unnamed protein product [Symbiodinium natans]|uniref:Uncharacterized protein n=1 Tax=Symbiodinium natans TaxID=878477 RepID=A0A812UHB2_9DINO|nr:unnamed protein product [Symbiodinium natans]
MDGVLAVAMKIPQAIEEQRRRLCLRRFCTRPLVTLRNAKKAALSRERERVATAKEQLALGGFAASKIQAAASADDDGDWFAACIPLSCLGDDDAMRRFIWWLYWLRLASDPGQAAATQAHASGAQVRILRIFGTGEPPEYPLRLLDPDVFEEPGQGPFDLVTVTDAPRRAHALTSSVQWPLRLRLLQPPAEDRPWKFGFFDAERYLLSYVTHLRKLGHGDRLVIYADAFDVAAFPCQRNLSKALDELNRSIVFGMEFDIFPAGLPGYPPPAAGSHSRARKAHKLPPCRPEVDLPYIWESRQPGECEPCLAMSETLGISSSGVEPTHAVAGEFLNGGFYGGRAAALEVALRRLLHVQAQLPAFNSEGKPFSRHGRSHQYLWNQYFLDNSEQVSLDYGGNFVVNLARRSISPRQFGIDEDTGQLKSVLFQRPVCFIHANAGGVADSTFYLLRTAYYLQADTSAWTGYRVPDELDALQLSGLRADKALQDRVVVDSNLCFGPFAHAPEWRGILSYVYLATPFNEVTFAGLEFFIARPLRSQASRSGGAEMVFDIVDKMPFPLRTRKQTGRAKPPNGTQTWFEARNRFDAQAFRVRVHSGDCFAFRCEQRCDLTYSDLEEDLSDPSWHSKQALDGRLVGVWTANYRDTIVGTKVTLDKWLPRSYAISASAEIEEFGFYAKMCGVALGSTTSWGGGGLQLPQAHASACPFANSRLKAAKAFVDGAYLLAGFDDIPFDKLVLPSCSKDLEPANDAAPSMFHLFPPSSGTLAYLSLEDTLRCAQVRQTWRHAASQPEALARVLHLPGDDGDSAPEGLRTLLGRGCLKRVEVVELAGACSWFPALLEELPDLQQLRVRGAHKGRPKADVDLALSSIVAASPRLTVLEFSYDGFGPERRSSWPAIPSLARLRVQSLPLCFTDLPNLFGAKELESLELQACPLRSSQTGIVSCGAKVQPRHLKVLRCGLQMALTLLLSVCLERLSSLLLDPPTDSKIQDELAKACAPQLGGIDPKVDACTDLQAQAQRELLAELRRASRASRSPESAVTPWRRLQQWLQASERSIDGHGQVLYRNLRAGAMSNSSST